MKHTEAYTITKNVAIGSEISLLNNGSIRIDLKLPADIAMLCRLEKEIKAIKEKYNI